MGFVEISAQNACDRVRSPGPPSASALVPFINCLELAGYVGDMNVQLAQQLPRLCSTHVFSHMWDLLINS